MQFKVDDVALKAIKLIEEKGFDAYVVGGAVRDFFLGVTPHDFDITTNASLVDIKAIFKDYKQNSYKKGHTIGIVIDHRYVEVSTFDGASIEEDLSNRDFTINAIAYKDGSFIDPFGGVNDIKNKLLKTPTDSNKILTSDPSRMLRAIRFSAEYNLEISPDIDECIFKNYNMLEKVSAERINPILSKILLTDKPSKYIRKYLDLFAVIFKPLKDCYKFNQHSRYHHLDVLEHILSVLDNTDPILELRLAALLHDIKKPDVFFLDDMEIGHFYAHDLRSSEYAKEVLKNLAYNDLTINIVVKLIYFHDRHIANTDKSVKRFINSYGKYDLDLFHKLRRADIMGQNPELLYRLSEEDEIYNRMTSLIESNSIISTKYLKVDGKYLEGLGFKNTEISKALENVLGQIILGNIKNDKDEITNYLLSHKDNTYIYIAKIEHLVKYEAYLPVERLNEISKVTEKNLRLEKKNIFILLEYAAFNAYNFHLNDLNLKKNKNGIWESNKLYISISHKNGYGVIALSTSNVGVDIESINPRIINERLLNKIKNENEENTSDMLSILKLWTKKEAIFKTKNSNKFIPKDINTLEYDTKSYLFKNYMLSVLSNTKNTKIFLADLDTEENELLALESI